MKILGLDLGRTTGWAIYDTASGEWKTGSRYLEGETRGAVFWAFQLFTGAIVGGVDVVAFEEQRFARGFSYIPGQMAFIQAECVLRELPYVGVHPSELKKWATGSGRASKQDMVEAAREHLPDLTEDDHDVADAVHVVMWAREHAMRPEAA